MESCSLLGKFVSGNFGDRELLGTMCMFYKGGKGSVQIAGYCKRNHYMYLSLHGKTEGNSGTVQLNCSKCLLEMVAVLPIYCVA